MRRFFNPLWLKRKAQIACTRAMGYRMYIYPRRRHGHEDFADISALRLTPRTIFDVGANVGQTALKFAIAFPQARIYCFEPVSSTYGKLMRNLQSFRAITCHQVALGREPGEATIYLTDQSETSSLVKPCHYTSKEGITVTTVDSFVSEHEVDRIDLLKVDAEGLDLDVLHGAEDMLRSQRVGLIQLEITFKHQTTTHVRYNDADNFLVGHGFELLGIYDQTTEWSGERRLRFANALFVHKTICDVKL